MSEITLAQAKTIIEAGIRVAGENGLAGIGIVVTDPSGAIRAAERGDKAGPLSIDIARAKARTALGFRRSSLKTAEVFGDKPAIVTGLNAATGVPFLPLGGGVVIIDAQGIIIGSAAVAGGAPEVDHEIVTAAVEAGGFSTLN